MRGAWRVRVDPTRCTGRGLCAEIVPELIQLDDWGFPIISSTPVRGALVRHARRAVAACPELALFLEPVTQATVTPVSFLPCPPCPSSETPVPSPPAPRKIGARRT